MKRFNEGDWVRFVSPLFTKPPCLFEQWLSPRDKMIRPDHSDHLREGFTVEASSCGVVQVLYIGANSPKEVLVDHLEKIENENET